MPWQMCPDQTQHYGAESQNSPRPQPAGACSGRAAAMWLTQRLRVCCSLQLCAVPFVSVSRGGQRRRNGRPCLCNNGGFHVYTEPSTRQEFNVHRIKSRVHASRIGCPAKHAQGVLETHQHAHDGSSTNASHGYALTPFNIVVLILISGI